MFDIAWSEFLVVAVVALVVVGPKDLPALLRTVGRTLASLRRMAGEFQGQFNEAMREAELDDLKNEVTGLKDKASRMVGASPFQIARDEIKQALTDKPKTTPSALAGEADGAKAEPDVPSALAPSPPIEPTPEPPAPTAGDFKIAAAPAMAPVAPELSAPAPKRKPNASGKDAPAAPKKAVKAAGKKAAGEAGGVKTPKKKIEKKTEKTPPGASA